MPSFDYDQLFKTIETNCTKEELEAAGVRSGTRMVVGKHRKRPLRMKDYITSYTLDNKASVAIVLALAEQLKTPCSCCLFEFPNAEYSRL